MNNVPEIINEKRINIIRNSITLLKSRIIFLGIMKVIAVIIAFESGFIVSGLFVTKHIFNGDFSVGINFVIGFNCFALVNYLFSVKINKFKAIVNHLVDYLIPIDLDDENSELTKKAFDFFSKHSDFDWVFVKIHEQNRSLLKGELYSCIASKES